MLSIRKILHPTDYSDLSRPAFELACALARDSGAELIVCHVAPPVLEAIEGGFSVEIPTGESEAMAARLGRVKPSDPRTRVSYKLLRGDPANEIVRLAADANADLVVMGTHGRSGFSRLLMGSVAESVVRKAPCPVVSVKTSPAAGEPGAPARARGDD